MNERQIFDEALVIENAEDRQAFLVKSCGDDQQLRGHIENLLKAEQKLGSFLESPPSGFVVSGGTATVLEKPGTRIGPYKLREKIGEGGMGVVYVADQKEPVRRRVALKVIKPGMDTEQVIARFNAERQALASMDHPNIAKVLDAGATETGRPYFVMELVNGIRLNKFCDQRKLTPKERLKLFIPICLAVQHAHQKGIIHRDLKPGNMLMALYDGEPVPKVIDFGVAKATSPALNEQSVYTQFGQIVGTLEYMSPEQAERNQLDIDTRSDVYSLGVVLYELLTGSTPFDAEHLRSVSFDETLRIIRDETPPKPSTKLTSSDALPAVAASRSIEPSKLSALVRGDLDWIVMKALDKDRTRRYDSAGSFAKDIRRYLDEEPVLACPPSVAYKFRKFARRNKVLLTTGSLIAVAIVLGLFGTTWQMLRANRQADEARTQAAIAVAVNDFINDDLLGQASPLFEPDRDIKLRTVVDRAAAKIGDRFGDQPLVKASIHNTLSKTFQALGLSEEAERHAEQAVKLRSEELGPEHPDTLRARNILGLAILLQERWAEAEELHREVFEIRKRVLGPNNLHTIYSLGNMADAIAGQGRYGEAEKLHREVLDFMKRVRGAEPWDTFWSIQNYAGVCASRHRYAEAEKLFREALKISEQWPPEEPDRLVIKQSLADVIAVQGRHGEAEKLLCETLPIMKRVMGPEHDLTLTTMTSLAEAINAQGRHAQADKLIDDVLETRQRKLGPTHQHTIRTMCVRANLFADQELLEKAVEVYQEIIELAPDCGLVYDNLGNALREQEKLDKAIVAHLKGIELRPESETSYNGLGATLEKQGKLDDAIEAFGKAIDLNPNYYSAYSNLGTVLESQGKLDEAIEAYRKAIDLNPSFAGAYNNLGLVLAKQRKFDEAIAQHRKAIDLNPSYAAAYNNLGTVFGQQEKLDAAIASFRKAINLDPSYALAYYNLGITLIKLERFDESIEANRKAIKLKPDYASAYNNLGATLAKQEKFDEAIVAYRTVIKLNPDKAEVYHNLGHVLVKQEKLNEAIGAFHKAIELDADGRVYGCPRRCFVCQGRYEGGHHGL